MKACISLKFLRGGHDDIDILVEDADRFIDFSDAVARTVPPDKIHRQILVEREDVLIDIRWLGDGYYDKSWESNMLAKKKVADNGSWYVMDDENYYYSLAYHAILHKECLSDEYCTRLTEMAKHLGINAHNEKEHLRKLDEWMAKHDYTYAVAEDEGIHLRNASQILAVNSGDSFRTKCSKLWRRLVKKITP